jgi:hypothetical protein
VCRRAVQPILNGDRPANWKPFVRRTGGVKGTGDFLEGAQPSRFFKVVAHLRERVASTLAAEGYNSSRRCAVTKCAPSALVIRVRLPFTCAYAPKMRRLLRAPFAHLRGNTAIFHWVDHPCFSWSDTWADEKTWVGLIHPSSFRLHPFLPAS